MKTKIPLTFGLISLFFSLNCFAGGSIPVDDPKIQVFFNQSHALSALVKVGLVLDQCSGVRLGRHWRFLAGERVGPYQCSAHLNGSSITIEIETIIKFFDENGNLIEDDMAFDLATEVVESSGSFSIIETPLEGR